MTWTILDYARKDCEICKGGGVEYVPDWREVHGWMVDTGLPEVCTCVDNRIKYVAFRYYEINPCYVSSNGDTEDDIPF